MFTIFYAIFGTLVTAKSLTTLNSVFMLYFKTRKEDLMLNRGLHMGTFFDMAKGRQSVSKEQFIIYKLLLMDIVDIKVIEQAELQFEKLDVNGDGELSILDLEIPETAKLATRRKKTRLKTVAEDIIKKRRSTLADRFAMPDGRERGISLMGDIQEYFANENNNIVEEGTKAVEDAVI